MITPPPPEDRQSSSPAMDPSPNSPLPSLSASPPSSAPIATDRPRPPHPSTPFPLALAESLASAEDAFSSNPKLHYFPRTLPVYSCKKCLTPLALQDELVSKAFSGRNGRAYLLHSTVNTKLGKQEERRLLTGMHTVADLHCLSCNTSLGWMYLKANDRDQEYKEGKYILEAARIVKENNYDPDRS